MLILTVLLTLGQIHFDDAPLPGVVIGNVTPFTGSVSTNYLQADINQDGETDLLLPDSLLLQRNGAFDTSAPIPFPPVSPGTDVDTFDGALFYKSPNQLSIFRFSEGAWVLSWQQTLDWPEEQSSFLPMNGKSNSLFFRRFASDIDGDGTPELVATDHRGIHLFRRIDKAYVAAGVIDFPSNISIGRSAPRPIWPEDQRRVAFPEQQMSFRFVIERGAIQTVAIRERRNDANRYGIQQRTLTLGDTGVFEAGAPRSVISEPLPSHLRPCRLNDDDVLDYAGGRWLRSESGPIPTPLFELWATLDGGRTFYIQRAAAYTQFRPHCSFVDFDGDGDMDMVMESAEWPRGSLREQLNKFLTDATVRHIIKIYQLDGGVYSRDPAIELAVEIDLGSPPMRPGIMLSRYEAGTIFNITGDLNGDHFRDLLVRTGPETLAIFIADGWAGFRNRPQWTDSVARSSDVLVADLNGDGLSDLYVNTRSDVTEDMPAPGLVRYARLEQP